MEDGGSVLQVELLYASDTGLDAGALAQRLRRRQPRGVVEDSAGGAVTITFEPDDSGSGGLPMPYTVSFLRTGAAPAHRFDPARARPLLAQSWAWKDAATAVADGQTSLLVTDPLGNLHSRERRVRLFREALAAAVEVSHPIALLFRNAEHVVEPGDFVDAVLGERARLFGLVNVRLFRVQDRAGDEVVMDTIGMAPFGLPDVQCHFTGLDPQQVARLLQSLAHYVFEHGDVIDDGHTVEGVAKGSRWTCQHEESLIAPHRVVVDVNPGPPHAVR